MSFDTPIKKNVFTNNCYFLSIIHLICNLMFYDLMIHLNTDVIFENDFLQTLYHILMQYETDNVDIEMLDKLRTFIQANNIEFQNDQDGQKDASEYLNMILNKLEDSLDEITNNKKKNLECWKGRMGKDEDSDDYSKFSNILLFADKHYLLPEYAVTTIEDTFIENYENKIVEKDGKSLFPKIVSSNFITLTLANLNFNDTKTLYDLIHEQYKLITKPQKLLITINREHNHNKNKSVNLEMEDYNLKGMIVHLGDDAESGHYVFILNDYENIWWEYSNFQKKQIEIYSNLNDYQKGCTILIYYRN